MKFTDWCQEVDRLLARMRPGFSTEFIQASTLRMNWDQNVKPEDFARRILVHTPEERAVQQPLVNLSMEPNVTIIRFSANLLTIMGWLTWVFGAFGACVGLWVLAQSSTPPDGTILTSPYQRPGEALLRVFYPGPLHFLGLLVWLVPILAVGALWHYFAQMLLMTWKKSKSD